MERIASSVYHIKYFFEFSFRFVAAVVVVVIAVAIIAFMLFTIPIHTHAHDLILPILQCILRTILSTHNRLSFACFLLYDCWPFFFRFWLWLLSQTRNRIIDLFNVNQIARECIKFLV